MEATRIADIAAIIAADEERRAARKPSYDPLTGNSESAWREAVLPAWEDHKVFLPVDMIANPAYKALTNRADYRLLRCRHDFEYWAASCVKIFHKLTCQPVPFVLNTPQRILLEELERQRRARKPIRVILLKARQWGGSTLVLTYMTWIQLLHRQHWNSIICSHLRNTSGAIRSNIRNILANYPADMWPYEAKPALGAWESSQTTRVISGSESTVTITSGNSPDAVRGLPFSMAHLSEVAFWKDSDMLSPEEIIRAVTGGIAMVPDSLIVLESTANGTGNFFHAQWNAARSGHSSFAPVFIPWYEIELNRLECPDPEAFVAGWEEREIELWNRGLTIDQIYWYSLKAREAISTDALHAEFPTTAEEAFTATDHSVFDTPAVENLRTRCRAELPLEQALARRPDLQWMLSPPGRDSRMSVWHLPPDTQYSRPSPADRFVIAVDIGGRTAQADYSVITVFDRLGCSPRRVARVAAQWRGHADHDLVARMAERMARAYSMALLVIESNSLESSVSESSQYILEQLNERYPNMYVRHSRDAARGAAPETRVGFHTNRGSKSAAIANLIRLVREALYEENSHDALNEMLLYQIDSSGAYAAKRGHHDDLLMTRAIGLYVIDSLPPLDLHPGYR